MKVTISFDHTRIVVPCGDGEITIRELTNLATMRYKKAIGKPNSFWVSVSSLKLGGSGGMLDPDDLICDVCDDREHLIAVFDSQKIAGHGVGGPQGDGMSSISSGGSEEDTCANSDSASTNDTATVTNYKTSETNNACMQSGMDANHPALQVRRGSEPFLNNTQNNQQEAGTKSEENRNPNEGNVQAVIASINALSSRNNDRTSASRRDQFIKHRSKSTIERPTNVKEVNTWQTRDHSQPGAFSNTHRLQSPSNKSSNIFQLSPNNANMNLRSSLRMGGIKTQNAIQNNEGRRPFEDFRIIHTNTAYPAAPILNKNYPSMTYGNSMNKGFESNSNRQASGHFGYNSDNETEDDRESNLDSITNTAEGGSLSVMRRREPLGASGNKPDHPKSPSQKEIQREKTDNNQPETKAALSLPRNDINSNLENNSLKRLEGNIQEIVIQNEIGPLGIHVVPTGEDGRLLVQGIEPGGRVDRDGRLAVGDRIVCINGYPLYDTPFDKAQEIFKEALYAKELRLEVIQGHLLYGDEMSPEGENNEIQDDKSEGVSSVVNSASASSKAAEPLAAGTKITSAVHANNTRKIGKKIPITLRKGHAGLGFSITTRDNPGVGDTPIYIKNIMAKGAAIEEGSLKPGDRLLEVNQVAVDGMTQSEVVTLLKNAPLNSLIYLIVSRHSTAASQTQSNQGATTSGHEEGSIQSKSNQEISEANNDIQPNIKSNMNQGSKKIQFDLVSEDDHRERITSDLNNSKNVEHELNKLRSSASDSPITSSDNFDDAMEEYQFPWKQRQILTFDIPVHDSERAGLGVSVKGKNSNGKEGGVSEDLGIFVKSVLYGGAASQDGRLKTNDQLVNINGMSLLGKANSEAMETLRMAMHEEGPVPGVITLTVARRCTDASSGTRQAGNNGQNNPYSYHHQPNALPAHLTEGNINHEKRDSLSSIGITSSDDEIVREYNISQAQPNFKMPAGLKVTRNPVVDRLMGKDGSVGGPRHSSTSVGVVPSNLRNDSYYIATHDTFLNGTVIQQQLNIQTPQIPQSTHTSSTTGLHHHQPLLIEREDANTPQNGDDVTLKSFNPESRDPQLVISSSVEDVDATTESLTSLVEVKPQAFARDMPGRQSMSEKRHATLDAKNTDTYKKRNKAREERENQQRLEQQQRMWKKSASLESLHMQTDKGTELADEEREALRTAYVRANSVRVSRNRGINESFRAAVDRSYEQERDFPGMSLGHVGQPINNEEPTSRHPDFVIEDLDAANEENMSNKNNVPVQAVLRRNKAGDTKDKKMNRNSRLFTGLSNMFTKSNKKAIPETTIPSSTENKNSGSLRIKSLQQKPVSVPSSLPSNSSTISGGSTSAVAGSSTSGGVSSSSSIGLQTHIPHSQSVHSTMAGYMKSRSGGTLQKLPNEASMTMKNSLSGDNIMMSNQQRLQRQQHPYYQQHGMYMQQAPPMPRRPAPVFDPQKHLREQMKGNNMFHRDANEHPRSHSHPRPPPKDMYDYLPSAMMRPGSRVGIADPLCAESTDYDVIQRLQQQPPSQPYPNQRSAPPPPPPAMQQHLNLIQHHQQNSNYPYAFYQDRGVPNEGNQPFHGRTGSNLSNGSSNNNNPSSSNLMANAVPKPRRPKSNYYEYESYNNNHSNYADVPPQVPYVPNQKVMQHTREDYHQQQQQANMYSLPRSTTTLPSLHKQSHPQFFHTDYN